MLIQVSGLHIHEEKHMHTNSRSLVLVQLAAIIRVSKIHNVACAVMQFIYEVCKRTIASYSTIIITLLK